MKLEMRFLECIPPILQTLFHSDRRVVLPHIHGVLRLLPMSCSARH
jgi:hypothetical protein